MPGITLQQALALHHHGRLAEAEALYRQILAVEPSHADALHLLGIVTDQMGQPQAAAELILKAIALVPTTAAYHCNLAEVCRKLGRLDEAIAACQRALQLKPDYAKAHNNLGAALSDQGDFDKAIAECRRAIQINPNLAEAHYNLGLALMKQGHLKDASDAYRRAIQLKPDYADAYNNLGATLGTLGQVEDAIAMLLRTTQIKPNFPEAHNNLGNVLKERGRLDEAIAAYTRAIQLKPDYADVHNNLGAAFKDKGEIEKAVAEFRTAIQLNRNFPDAYNNLGTALRDHAQLDEVVAAFRLALELKPDYGDAQNNLGVALTEQGKLDDAIAAYRSALQVRPNEAQIGSNLLLTLHCSPHSTPQTIFAEQLQWNRIHAEPLAKCIASHANNRDPERRLRIGYVSPDFWDHVAGRYLLPLFEHHARERFEITCYSGVVRPDAMTERFRSLASRWRSILGVTDERAAEMIRADEIDILVDLSQHMAGNRLPLFARKPAPVQVSYLGYPAGTGLEAIEYRISDRYLEGGFAAVAYGTRERVFFIDSFWCFDPCGIDVAVNALPVMQTGVVTFGCLNNFCKVNEPVLALWAQVLRRVSGSRLVMLSPAGSHRQGVLDILGREGIEASRVEFVAPRPRREYLEMYHRLDLVLDTFPYNGHTTSLDALWMGVPVISLAGQLPVARAGVSQLSNLGLPELIAETEDDYARIAEEWAGDLTKLAGLRSLLRERMKRSVLMDAPHFATQIEQAYRQMWRAWCAKQASGPHETEGKEL